MPQMNKGGKFIFGKSIIRNSGELQFPEQAIREYDITTDGKIYLFTGSKSTGGFCVTRKGLLMPSKLSHILSDNPGLNEYTLEQGMFVKYKGRSYAWLNISTDGKIIFSKPMMTFLNVAPGMNLLSIRSSNIAFTMGAYGRLVEESMKHKSEIPIY